MRKSKRALLLLLVLLLMLPTLSAAEDAASCAPGAIPCEYTVPEEAEFYVRHLYDGDPFTTMTIRAGESIVMQVPNGAHTLFFDFYEANRVYTIFFYNAAGNVISSAKRTTAAGFLRMPIEENTASVKIVSESRLLTISDWYAVADESLLPFPDTNDHADILVILNEPGDELTKLGGLLPMLCGEHGLSAKVVYLNGADGYHSHQCLQILKEMGIQKAPYFGAGSNTTVKSDGAALNALGISQGALRRFLTQEIRTCRPQILITLNPNSGRDVYMDRFIARMTVEAAGLADDPERYSEYEPYSVPKLYTLSDTGETVFAATEPLYVYEGKTADALADELYQFYREERMFRRDMPDTVRFTLWESTVGEDAQKNDLLENLSKESFAGYRNPTPTPAPTEIPTPTPGPTEAPTSTTGDPKAQQPEETVSDRSTTRKKAENPAKLWWLPGVIGIAASVCVWFLLHRQPMRIRLLFLLPLCIGMLLSVLWYRGVFSCARKQIPVTAEQPSAVPTEKPTFEPTEQTTPVPKDTPAPKPTEAPTPEPKDAYFLSEPGEEFELDWDNGHWWYRSDVLAIDVREVHTTQEENQPLVYYVADIRMREYSSYRSGVRSPVQPWVYARLEKAVLAITGDNLTEAEKELKGCLIRQGRFYWNSGLSETLVIEDGMKLSVLPAFGASERILLDHGIRDTYGFGPTLVENGQISETTKKHRVDHPNPRCGIGMVEPGHWVAIATEGRQYDFSYSITLGFFAQMFVDYGCTVAYNMDGGSSVGIVFMGEALNRHYKPGTIDIQRKWNDALLFGYSEQIPSPNERTIHDGYRHGF